MRERKEEGQASCLPIEGVRTQSSDLDAPWIVRLTASEAKHHGLLHRGVRPDGNLL